MGPVDPVVNLVIQAVTALVAVVALVLGVMNYQREKRRDEVQIHVGLQTNYMLKPGGEKRADSVEATITNTGQRPTTLLAVALVFARGRIWRWGWGKRYVWSGSTSLRGPGGPPLVENKPQEARWRWEEVQKVLRDAGMDGSLSLLGLRVRVAGDRLYDRAPRYRKEIEAVARDVMADRVPVERRGKS